MMNVIRERKLWKTSCFLLALAMTMQEAHAGLSALFVSVKVKTHSEVIAGLDAPTRKLIEDMPANVRAEVVDMIRQSLPLVEQSFAKMLEDVDTRLEQRINQAVCASQAIAQGAGDEIKAILLAKQVTPVGELVELYDKRGKKFKSGSARSLAVSYTDYLHNAGVTACRGADIAVAEYANQMRRLARERLKTWKELEDQCSSPSHCLVKRYAEVSALLKTSDPRDVVEVGAIAALSGVKSEVENSGWLGSGKPDWVSVEVELLKLRMIDRSLSSAKGMRVTAAHQRIAEASDAIGRAEAALSGARQLLSSNTTSQNDASISAVAAALPSNRDQINAQLNLAIIGDPSRKAEGEAWKDRLALLWIAGDAIRNSATQSTQALNAAEQRRLEEQRRAAEVELKRNRQPVHEHCASRTSCSPH